MDFGTWSKVFKAKYTIIRTFDQVPKKNLRILALDRIFQSSEKSQKTWSSENETFDQLKKETFDQVKFGLTTPCQLKQYYKKLMQKWIEK